ncbi:MAG: 16S rRNA (cytosine(967)-C(5))-methyltransferase RsmB [Deltaproteobacteria bacterium]
MEQKISAREYALKLLYKVENESKYSNIIRDELFREDSLSETDKAFFNQLFFGVLTRKLTLDAVISKKSKIKPNKISPWINNVLRIGIYQIVFLNKIPVSAACSESVKLAKKYGHTASASFVNAILRNVIREIEELKSNGSNNEELITKILGLSGCSDIQRMSLLYSHPEWMIDKWIKQFGKEFTEELCKANNQNPLTAVRVNINKASRQEVQELLKQKGFECELSQYSKQGIILNKGNPINELYEQGLYTVQDEAAMLAAEILEPKPDEIIADVCAAPGGKTTHIAELMGNKGKIYAFDIHPHRVDLIAKTAKRLGINIIEPIVHDAAELKESLAGKCDRVLVDVPCSGLGVIRRKPEIKWTRKPEDIIELLDLQKRILSTCAKYVKPNGRLVYSTCTLNNEENEMVIEEFLKSSKEFNIDTQTMKKYCILNDDKKSGISFYPNVHKTDGFFIAVLKRIAED